MILKKFSLVLQMCPLLPVWISKNICKNTKPCEFTFVKNKELLALFLQQILRTLKMPECLKPKNIQSLNWILLVLIKKKECSTVLLVLWICQSKHDNWASYRKSDEYFCPFWINDISVHVCYIIQCLARCRPDGHSRAMAMMIAIAFLLRTEEFG